MKSLILIISLFIFSANYAQSATQWKVIKHKKATLTTQVEIDNLFEKNYNLTHAVTHFLNKHESTTSDIKELNYTLVTFKYVGPNSCLPNDKNLFYVTTKGTVELFNGEQFLWYPVLPNEEIGDPCRGSFANP
ncbi:MAG: hypothetical protein U0T83_02840 [Bacteriovoracaceae bacterium]